MSSTQSVIITKSNQLLNIQSHRSRFGFKRMPSRETVDQWKEFHKECQNLEANGLMKRWS